MNSTAYIDWLMSADDPTSELARGAITIGQFENDVRQLEEVEEDHIRGDVEVIEDDYPEEVNRQENSLTIQEAKELK